MFRELHPRIPREKIKSTSPDSGVNAPIVAHPEDNWLRCSRCNFVLNRSRFPKGRGDGLAQSAGTWGRIKLGDNAATDAATALTNVTDSASTSGCPFCGSYMYD